MASTGRLNWQTCSYSTIISRIRWDLWRWKIVSDEALELLKDTAKITFLCCFFFRREVCVLNFNHYITDLAFLLWSGESLTFSWIMIYLLVWTNHHRPAIFSTFPMKSMNPSKVWGSWDPQRCGIAGWFRRWFRDLQWKHYIIAVDVGS